jgi:hypothetical protein
MQQSVSLAQYLNRAKCHEAFATKFASDDETIKGAWAANIAVVEAVRKRAPLEVVAALVHIADQIHVDAVRHEAALLRHIRELRRTCRRRAIENMRARGKRRQSAVRRREGASKGVRSGRRQRGAGRPAGGQTQQVARTASGSDPPSGDEPESEGPAQACAGCLKPLTLAYRDRDRESNGAPFRTLCQDCADRTWGLEDWAPARPCSGCDLHVRVPLGDRREKLHVCSPHCYELARNAARRAQRQPSLRRCDGCSRTFRPRRHGQRFCEPGCRRRAHSNRERPAEHCRRCGTELLTPARLCGFCMGELAQGERHGVPSPRQEMPPAKEDRRKAANETGFGMSARTPLHIPPGGALVRDRRTRKTYLAIGLRETSREITFTGQLIHKDVRGIRLYPARTQRLTPARAEILVRRGGEMRPQHEAA